MVKKRATKVPVSRRALIQRINRALAKDNEQLRFNRRGPDGTFGWYYVIRYGRGGFEPSTNIIDYNVDPEDLGQELKVIKSWEAVEKEEER